MNRRPLKHGRQRGVVLIIALVMLVVISLLAALSMRNATSSEAVSGNVRTTELATQAAEMALRFCEDKVVTHVSSSPGAITSASFDVTITSTVALRVLAAGTATYAVDPANWDGATTNTLAIPLTEVNQASPALATYPRAPECMAEHLPVLKTASTIDYTSTYQITARGFGPEVAADTTNAKPRPNGSEVWLQSTITVTTP